MAYTFRKLFVSEADTPETIEYDVVRQFARILRLQANMLERDGDTLAAHALRQRAARSLRAVACG
ncbi:MAG TPA: hypothetical protein VEB64_09990 [Azospirillaceae bacterium]|nr:hypothetical protein [Azospirillaceae bacterium]